MSQAFEDKERSDQPAPAAGQRNTVLEVPGLRFDLIADRPQIANVTAQIFAARISSAWYDPSTRPQRVVTYEIQSGRPSSSGTSSRVLQDGEFIRSIRSDGQLVNYLETLITHRLARHLTDNVLIHAGLVSFHGQGMLIPGRSGAGKSTTTCSLALREFEYFSDELAVVDGAGTRAFPFPKMPSVKRGGRSVLRSTFPAIHFIYEPDEDEVAYVEAPTLPSQETADTGVPISWVLLPSRPEGTRTSLEPIGKAEALKVIVEESLDLKLKQTEGFNAFVALLESAQCFTIQMGDVHEGVDLVRRLISKG